MKKELSCLGDGQPKHEDQEGDAKLHLPGPVRGHVLHPGGQHSGEDLDRTAQEDNPHH